MEVRNCKKCNAVFNYYSGYPLCADCKIEDERIFKRVREYVKLNPGVTVDQVSEALHISVNLIIRYLREERLEVHDQSNVVLICELCGKSIKTGRFCQLCNEKIEADIMHDANQAEENLKRYNESEGNKIRFLKHRE